MPPKSRRKKKRRRKLPSSLRRKKLHNKLDAICLGTDLHIDWLHPPEADCRNPRFRAGNAEPGDLKTNLPGLRPSRNDESHRQLNSHSMRAYCPGEATRRNERTNGQKTRSTSRRAGAQEVVLYLWREKSFVVNGASRRHMRAGAECFSSVPVSLARNDSCCEKSRCCHSCGGSASKLHGQRVLTSGLCWHKGRKN